MKPAQLPANYEAEQAVLGAVFLSPEVLDDVSRLVRPEDFHDPRHQNIFSAMLGLAEKGQGLDVAGVVTWLRDKGLPVDSAYLVSLIQAEPLPSRAVANAKLVRQAAQLRSLALEAAEIGARALEPGADPAAVLDAAADRLGRLADAGTTGRALPLADLTREARTRLEHRLANRGEVMGLATGFPDLDARTGGLQPGQLVIIAARPSMGKTALALQVAFQAAQRTGRSVLFASLEMSREELSDRLLAMTAGVDGREIRSGFVKERLRPRLDRALCKMGEIPLIVDDTSAATVAHIRAEARRLQRRGGLGLVVVDYLQLMGGHGRSREEEVASFSRGLKSLAKDLGVPVMALAQLSRKVEDRTDRRPMLSDLRESGALEQDADLVIFIYRDDYYHKGSTTPGVAEINIAKQRNGPLGTVKLRWNAPLTRFESLDRRPEPIQPGSRERPEGREGREEEGRRWDA